MHHSNLLGGWKTAAFVACYWVRYPATFYGKVLPGLFGPALEVAILFTEKLTHAKLKLNPNHVYHQVWCWVYGTNTKSLAKEFSKILIFEYFGYLKIGFDVFFDADSESPRMT